MVPVILEQLSSAARPQQCARKSGRQEDEEHHCGIALQVPREAIAMPVDYNLPEGFTLDDWIYLDKMVDRKLLGVGVVEVHGIMQTTRKQKKTGDGTGQASGSGSLPSVLPPALPAPSTPALPATPAAALPATPAALPATPGTTLPGTPVPGNPAPLVRATTTTLNRRLTQHLLLRLLSRVPLPQWKSTSDVTSRVSRD